MDIFMLICMALAMQGAVGAFMKECGDDSQCDLDQFCYMRRACTDCVQCAVYHRHPPALLQCVKEPSNCGNCVEGFEPEILIDGRTRELCVPVTPSTRVAVMEPLQVVESSVPTAPVVATFIVVAVLCSLFLVFKYCKTQSFKVSQHTRFLPSNESRSPSSDALFAPSAPPHSSAVSPDDDEGVKLFEGYHFGTKSEAFQQASKYLDPAYVRSPNNDNNNNGGVVLPADQVDGTPAPNGEPYLIDENTLPSDWSPGPAYGSEASGMTNASGGPLITSFEGILRLNAAGAGAGANAGSEPEPQPTTHTAQGNNGTQQINITNITVLNTAPSTTGVFNITKT